MKGLNLQGSEMKVYGVLVSSYSWSSSDPCSTTCHTGMEVCGGQIDQGESEFQVSVVFLEKSPL